MRGSTHFHCWCYAAVSTNKRSTRVRHGLAGARIRHGSGSCCWRAHYNHTGGSHFIHTINNCLRYTSSTERCLHLYSAAVTTTTSSIGAAIYVSQSMAFSSFSSKSMFKRFKMRVMGESTSENKVIKMQFVSEYASTKKNCHKLAEIRPWPANPKLEILCLRVCTL